MEPIKIKSSVKRGDWQRGFGVEIFYPGTALSQGDSGIGAIGRIDRALIQPGHVIAMHPHKDDEIFTYKRGGRMLHLDTVGNREEVNAHRLMMMNAGHTFQHEEQVIGDEPTKALQIFLRPRAGDLQPMVQFHDFEDVYSDNAWRLLVAPQGATFEVRADAWVRDAHLDAGRTLAIPALPTATAVNLLFVFEGEVRLGDLTIVGGELYYLGNTGGEIEAEESSDLVLFTTDCAAPVFKGGMFSGNVMAV
jgi:redox-sensitive bicupin YhaK (pirin superfamily)